VELLQYEANQGRYIIEKKEEKEKEKDNESIQRGGRRRPPLVGGMGMMLEREW
jgi:hypothetical protein